MNIIQGYLKLQSWSELRRMKQAQKDPQRSQLQVLRKLLQKNSQTRFGQEHQFAAIESLKQFQDNVPVRRYAQLLPYIEQIVADQQGICTQEHVRMFTRTSGTTSQPKLIPVTTSWERALTRMTKLWLSQLLTHLPNSLDGKILIMASPAIEGYTASQIPYGSMSGVTVQRLPPWLQRAFVIPYEVCCIEDVQTRYLLSLRFAMAEHVSLFATPNATTFLQLAKTANEQLDVILRAIHDGTLGVLAPSWIATAPSDAHSKLLQRCKANPRRVRQIEAALRKHPTTQVLAACWPGQKTICCWLGGSAGLHASKLAAILGPSTCYDLGLLTSEGRLSLPMMPNTPGGLLPLHEHVFEFFPAEERLETESSTKQQLLLPWQLEVGKKYHIVFSSSNGLWRYAIDDIVEICAMDNQSPTIAFVRKDQDFISITGEKIHSNQVQEAMQVAAKQCQLDLWQYRCIANLTHNRHDLLIELKQPAAPSILEAFLQTIDLQLSHINFEYAAKRKSNRLNAPYLFVMEPGWSDAQIQADLRQGKREYQYKWQVMQSQWNATSQQAILSQIPPKKDAY